MKFRSSLLRHSVITLLLVLLFLTACGAPTPDVGRDNPQDRPMPAGMAPVESIEILILESFPVQVLVRVRGNLPDSCTDIDQINQRSGLENNAFWVEITTVRPTDKACTKAPVPFEETISLVVYGLPAGTYTVDVNGVSGTFTLDVDNVLPEGAANDAPEGALSVPELLQNPVYDTEVKVCGQVSLLGELFCPCFELTSGGKKVMVWYGLMVEDDGTERPAVSVEGIRNGDRVIVTGELKTAGVDGSLNDLWPSKIENAE